MATKSTHEDGRRKTARLGAGDDDGEAGFYTRLRCGFDGAIVCLDGAFDYREPESSSLDVGLGVVLVHAIESFENEGKVGGGNSDAIVADYDLQSVVREVCDVERELEFTILVLFDCIFQ